ncbi:hypothetical protein EPN87_00435, partial [archaeon]
MATPFDIVVTNLRGIGAYQFLFPWLIASAVFYGLLRRSQIFGKPEDNVAVNAVVATVAAFMVMAYPILQGVNVEKQMSTFFFNSLISILVIIVGLIIASMVFPAGLGEELAKKFKGGTLIAFAIFGILIALGVLASSGLTNVFFPKDLTSGISSDVALTLGIVAAMVLSVMVIAFVGG